MMNMNVPAFEQPPLAPAALPPANFSLTLRDWFAGQALRGLLIVYQEGREASLRAGAGELSYKIADAMIERRAQTVADETPASLRLDLMPDMTLRDWLAGMSIPGVLTPFAPCGAAGVAEKAYMFADQALLSRGSAGG